VVVALALAISSGALSGVSWPYVVGAAALSSLAAWSLAGLAVGLGAQDPQFNEQNPARIASGVGGVVFMFLGLAYLAAMTGLLTWPMLWVDRAVTLGWSPGPARWAGAAALTVAALGLSVLTHALPMRRGATRLDAHER
jgi:hypothetical protein